MELLSVLKPEISELVVQEVAETFSAVKREVSGALDEISTVKKDNEKRMTEFDLKFERLDAISRRQDIIIVGIPYTIRDIKEFVIKAASIVGYNLSSNDILFCKRFSGSSDVIIKLTNINIRDNLMAHYFSSSKLKLEQVVETDISSRIYFNDNLTPALSGLKKRCIGLKKQNKIDGFFIFHGNMYIKVNGINKGIKISSHEDINTALLPLQQADTASGNTANQPINNNAPGGSGSC